MPHPSCPLSSCVPLQRQNIGKSHPRIWDPWVLISMRSKACRYPSGEDSLADRCICVTPIDAEIASILYALNYTKLTQQRDLVMPKSGRLLCVGAKPDRKTIKQMHYINLGFLILWERTLANSVKIQTSQTGISWLLWLNRWLLKRLSNKDLKNASNVSWLKTTKERIMYFFVEQRYTL